MKLTIASRSCRGVCQAADARAFVRLAAAVSMLACQGWSTGRAADPPPGPSRPRIVDPAIQPAGGGGCTSCGPGGCRQSHGGRHAHHAGCREGACVPYCPVRPQQFGFYGTQWRRWPGQQVMQVSAEQDAAPVSPPRSAVPKPAEESFSQNDEDAAAETADSPAAALPEPSEGAPATEPAPQSRPEPGLLEPAPESRPGVPAATAHPPAAEPGPESPAPKAPATPEEPPARPADEVKPDSPQPARPAPEPKPRPEDENLFEVLSGWRAQRRFAVNAAGGTEAAAAGDGQGPRAVNHVGEPPVRPVPRVPFDPAAETRRLRSAR